MTTIEDIYAGINPLPAMLTAKGKVKPEVSFVLDANAGLAITMNWIKPYSPNEWDRQYKHFSGKSFAESLGAAKAFVNGLPSAEEAKLHNFMGSHHLSALITAVSTPMIRRI